MIGFLSGKFMTAEDGGVLLDVGGVGYSVLVSSRISAGLSAGMPVELYIHTNLRENALELFGFSNGWEKKVFHALTSVSGVGPRTALSILGGLDAETILSAIVREDRVTLNSVSGVGKKTTERLLIELGDKARKLLAERPASVREASDSQTARLPVAPSTKKGSKSSIPPQGASARPVDIADMWNEALAALVNLGYREIDAIAAIKVASNKISESDGEASLEKLIMSSLQLMSRGLS